MVKIWKRVNGDLVGFGNGFRAVIYETRGNEFFDVHQIATVLIYKGEKKVAKHIATTEAEVKTWAEKNYLKRGTK